MISLELENHAMEIAAKLFILLFFTSTSVRYFNTFVPSVMPSHESPRDHQGSEFVHKSKEPLLQTQAWDLGPFQHSGWIREPQAQLWQGF